MIKLTHLSKSDTIPEAYIKAMDYVVKNGQIEIDERGTEVTEVPNYVMDIKNPLSEHFGVTSFYPHPKGTIWTGKKLDKYIYDFTKNPSKGTFVYSYGQRLLAYPDSVDDDLSLRVNQIDVVKNRLKKFNYTRRAIISLYNPFLDSRKEDIPCFNHAQFTIRDDRLNVNAVWRSQDYYGALYPNLCGLASLLSDIAIDLGISVGNINLHSMSAHIYKADIESAESIIQLNNGS